MKNKVKVLGICASKTNKSNTRAFNQTSAMVFKRHACSIPTFPRPP